jgi:TAG lipase / lysophosphatidylethanolamine acyltransferase
MQRTNNDWFKQQQLIWSAALASNMSSAARHVRLLCKDETGAIIAWPHAEDMALQPWRRINYTRHESPLARLAELFNVNHFIVSQTRPYVVPFLLMDTYRSDNRQSNQQSLTRPLMRLLLLEIRHRLKQIDYVGFLPSNIRRLLIDESIPGPSITLIPNLSFRDLAKILDNPTKESFGYWILQGERGVWPAVSALKVRCAIEIELDKGYQIVRRRRPSDSPSLTNVPINTTSLSSAADKTGSNITTTTATVTPTSAPRHSANEGAPRKRRMNTSDS